MKMLVVLCLLFFGNMASGQITINVSWTKSILPRNNKFIFYSPQKLSWANFEGTPPPPSVVGAITFSGFGYRSSMKASRNGDGTANIDIYCFMDPDKSWVRPDKKTDYILNHEQRHFDITYIHAKQFLEKVKSLPGTTKSINEEIPKLYKEYSEALRQMQTEYDTQTANGQITAEQEKWNTRLDALLK